MTMKQKMWTLFNSCKRRIQSNRKVVFAFIGKVVYQIIIFIVEKIIDKLI